MNRKIDKCLVPLRLGVNQFGKLKTDSHNAGLTVSDYLRKLISNQEINPMPPNDFKDLAWEISKVGNNLSRLVEKAEAEGISKEDISAANFLLEKIIKLMREMG